VLLSLLEDKPSNGHELMGELNRLFGPRYRASPGSVYPALAALRSDQLVEPAEEHGTGSVRITKAGRDLRSAKAPQIAKIELRTDVNLSEEASIEPVVDRFAAQIKRLSGRIDRKTVERILDGAVEAINKEVGAT
jgi:DNA-binding PadR family transcriptional regulator